MSLEQNHIRDNDLKDVYNKSLSVSFTEKIKHLPTSSKFHFKIKHETKLKEGFDNTHENSGDFENQISNLKEKSKTYNLQSSLVDDKSNELKKEIINYDTYNDILKKPMYQTIDNEGNLLLNNIDIEPTKIDAMLKDSAENQLYQNNFFIAGSIVITTLFFGIVAFVV